MQVSSAQAVREEHSRSFGLQIAFFEHKSGTRSALPQLQLDILRGGNVRKVRSRISSSEIATLNCNSSTGIELPHLQLENRKSSMRSILPQVKPPAFLRSQAAQRCGQERLTRETDMKDWATKVAEQHAQHHGQHHAQRHSQHHVQHPVGIMRSITRSVAHDSFTSQRRAQEKLTGEIVKHCLCFAAYQAEEVSEILYRVSMLPGHPSLNTTCYSCREHHI